MTEEIKRIPIAEFRERGYLHEVNRLVLHPLGLALEIEHAHDPGRCLLLAEDAVQEILEALSVVMDHPEVGETIKRLINTFDVAERIEPGDEFLGSVWDGRDEAEGIYYGDDLLNPEKAASVCAELLARREARVQLLGYLVQPIPEAKVLTVNYLDPDKVSVLPRLEFEQ